MERNESLNLFFDQPYVPMERNRIQFQILITIDISKINLVHIVTSKELARQMTKTLFFRILPYF